MAKKTCPLPPGSRLWAYLRVSSDDQAERGLPVAGMRQSCQEYAERCQLLVTRWFVDEAKSGGSTVGRDGFNEMVYLARETPRPADGILVWDVKRFARNLLDSQFYKADLRRRGWTLIFLSDDIPQSDFAPVYEALLDWKAEKDRGDIAKDTQRGLQALVRLGYAPGACPPRGYEAEVLNVEIEGRKRRVRRWVLDPDWCDKVRRAWEMRAGGASYPEINKATGLYKNISSLASFFVNETYLGVLKCGDLKVEGAHEPLVSRELWDAVQKRRLPGPRAGHPRRVSSRYLLSGLVFCSLCGAIMSGSFVPARQMPDGYRREWRYYMCATKRAKGGAACRSKRLKAEKLERAVLDALLGEILTPEHLQDLLVETNRALSAQRQEVIERQQDLQRKLARLDRAIGRLIDVIEAGDSAAVRDRLADRERERVELCAEVERLEHQLHRTRIQITPSALEELIADIHEVLTSENVPEARRLLQTLVLRIEAGPDSGVMFYTFPFGHRDDRSIGTVGDGLVPIDLSSEPHEFAFAYPARSRPRK